MEEIPLIFWATLETSAIISLETGVHAGDQWV